jgi:putative membrane-bound dehydrogenase-like protein
MLLRRLFAVCLVLAWTPALLGQPLPKVMDDRLVIELVASEPDIVTPTGIAMDERGRVWCIENNTHQRQADYKGHPSDRIRIYDDFDEKGRARRVKTFADGFKNSMGLTLHYDGQVFLATRTELFVLRDTNGDDVADEKKSIVKLDTKGDYPHNGLSGFAFDALGNMYFGLGENLGESYKLIGSDGITLTGGGEGGNIYRCRPDGTKLVRVATGFWNPFGLTVDAFGRLFAVDNDPDSRGPCRLLHIIQGGDYGYRFRNGRKGTHPFTAWNGELPGTLPMVAGTAEAPSGIVAYESNGLPKEYIGRLISTSWGDHVIEYFDLKPRGASFTSQAKTLVKGDENFRAVGIVTAPDGSLIFSDWVDKSYPVHGKGRIWRLRMKERPKDDGLRPSMVQGFELKKLRQLLSHPKVEIRRAATDAIAKHKNLNPEFLLDIVSAEKDRRARVHALWAAASLPHVIDRRSVADVGYRDKDLRVQAVAVPLLCSSLKELAGIKDDTASLEKMVSSSSPQVLLQWVLQLRWPEVESADESLLANKDPFIVGAALEAFGNETAVDRFLKLRAKAEPALRVVLLLALRRGGSASARAAIPDFLADASPDVRRAAIQWVAEEHLKEFSKLLPAAASHEPVTKDLFEAWLAANDFLSGKKRFPTDEPSGEDFIAKILQDDKQPVAFRTLSMRMLRPDHKALNVERLSGFLASKDAGLRREAVRTLMLRGDEPSQELLRHLATDEASEPSQRAAAVAGLAHSAQASRLTQRLLLSLLDKPEYRRDALRSLRQSGPNAETERVLLDWWDKLNADARDKSELAEQIVQALHPAKESEAAKRLNRIAEAAGAGPRDEAAWRQALDGPGDAAAGERLFFHARGPRCFACHRVDGRGTAIGPDLSTIGRALNREKLIESILTPSKEIAPQFTSWVIVTKDGKSRTGVIVEEKFDSTIVVADTEGKLETIPRLDIEQREASKTSIMPENLPSLMTRQEFRDLLAFLEKLK